MKSDSYDEHLSPLLWSVQTASFYTTNFHEVIKACVDSGFTSIELGLSRNTISLSKEEVIETFMTYGVNIRSVHQRLEVYYDYSCTDLKSSIEEACSWADSTGVKKIVVHSPFKITSETESQFKKRWESFLIGLTEYVPNYEICVENLDPYPQKRPFPVFWTWEEYTNMLCSLGLFICFDTAHAVRSGDICESYNICRNLVRNIHFSDSYNGNDHFIPGDGELNLSEFYKRLSLQEQRYMVLEVNMVNNYPFLSPHEILQRFKRYMLSSSLLNN